jgi:UDP-3-O-[3-hydroxymyristoyl] glucosamine N-acyltransferase
MANTRFFAPALTPTLSDVAEWTEATTAPGADLTRRIGGVAPLDRAGSRDLTFLDNPRYADALSRSRAAAVLAPKRYAALAPEGVVALIVREPYRAFAHVLARLYPDAMRPTPLFAESGVSAGASVHPLARLEAGVTVDPGAVIGANAVIGAGVRIGRQSVVGANATVSHALVGDRVILHPGVRIGQDGFGFAMGAKGHLKVPQVGRVIIQDDVEIGANTTIDRGANRDTVIGEGSKIDNQVQIAHNVVIGRHCVIVAQAGVSGSTTIGDFVAIGGQAGITGHLRIGDGAQIGADAGLMNDVPAGQRWAGSPAKPAREFWREMAVLKKLATSRSGPETPPEA